MQEEKERLEVEVESRKKQGMRAEWLAQQDQLLLQAKNCKHMAKERLIPSLADPLLIEDYSADAGIVLYVDFIIGLPPKVAQIQVVYYFYEVLYYSNSLLLVRGTSLLYSSMLLLRRRTAAIHVSYKALY